MSRKPRDFTAKAMSPIMVDAVRKAMAVHGINATVGQIQHYIRNTLVLTGFRWDDLSECARQQRIMASDWLFPDANKHIPKPAPLIPDTVAAQFPEVRNNLTPHQLQDRDTETKPNGKPLPLVVNVPAGKLMSTPIAVPVPKLKEPANVVRVVEPPELGEPGEPKKDDKRNILDAASKYKLIVWLDSLRDFAARNKWHMDDVIREFGKEQPNIVVSEGNVHGVLKILGMKLAQRPAPPRPRKPPKADPVFTGDDDKAVLAMLTRVLDTIAEFGKRLEYLETNLGVTPPSQPEQGA